MWKLGGITVAPSWSPMSQRRFGAATEKWWTHTDDPNIPHLYVIGCNPLKLTIDPNLQRDIQVGHASKSKRTNVQRTRAPHTNYPVILRILGFWTAPHLAGKYIIPGDHYTLFETIHKLKNHVLIVLETTYFFRVKHRKQNSPTSINYFAHFWASWGFLKCSPDLNPTVLGYQTQLVWQTWDFFPSRGANKKVLETIT